MSSSTPSSKSFIRAQIEARSKALGYWPMPAHTVNYMVTDVEAKLGEAVAKIITPTYIKGAFSKAEPTQEGLTAKG